MMLVGAWDVGLDGGADGLGVVGIEKGVSLRGEMVWEEMGEGTEEGIGRDGRDTGIGRR